jgi:hypothetical protein
MGIRRSHKIEPITANFRLKPKSVKSLNPPTGHDGMGKNRLTLLSFKGGGGVAPTASLPLNMPAVYRLKGMSHETDLNFEAY